MKRWGRRRYIHPPAALQSWSLGGSNPGRLHAAPTLSRPGRVTDWGQIPPGGVRRLRVERHERAVVLRSRGDAQLKSVVDTVRVLVAAERSLLLEPVEQPTEARGSSSRTSSSPPGSRRTRRNVTSQNWMHDSGIQLSAYESPTVVRIGPRYAAATGSGCVHLADRTHMVDHGTRVTVADTR